MLALTLLTIVAVSDLAGIGVGPRQDPTDSEGPTAANAGGSAVEADASPTAPDGVLPGQPSSEVPDGGSFTTTGTGTFRTVPGTSPVVGAGTQLVRYGVQVEDGVVLPDGDQAFARTVTATLSHPRGWSANGRLRLERVDRGPVDLQIVIASRDTARDLCGFDIPYDTSCFRGGTPGRVVLNTARWERGALSFQGDIGQYRRYLVNHEVGHFFDNPHQPCGAPGAPAPLMMQQTLTTANDELAALTAAIPDVPVPRDGAICRPNEWPFPSTP